MSKEIGYREQNPRWWSPQSPRPPWRSSPREKAERKAEREEHEAELRRDRAADEAKERRYEQ